MALSEGKRELSVYDIFPGKLLYPSDEGIGESGINLQDIFQNPIEEFKKWQPAVHWSPASKT